MIIQSETGQPNPRGVLLDPANQSKGHFQSRLQELGVQKLDQSVVIETGQVAYLTTETGTISVVPPKRLSTPDLDTYKTWIGRPNGSIGTDAWPLPTIPAPTGTALETSSKQQQAIELAGQAYLFGDSAEVATYKPAIEAAHRPFKAALYALKHVTLMPDARLIIQGDPAALVVASLTLHPGAKLVAYTACNAAFGRCTKVPAADQTPGREV